MKQSEEAQAAGRYIKTLKDPDKRLYAQRYFAYLLGYDLKPPSPRPLKEEEARELHIELDKFFQSPSSQYSTTVNAPQTKPKSEVHYYWVEKNLPYETWAIVEVWPGGLVRSPFKTKEEAIKREEEIWEGVYELKLVPSPQEKFPAQNEALKKLYPYEFLQYHDDGDLTIQQLVPRLGVKPPVSFRDLIKGKQYVVTTDGEVFAHHTGNEALKRITTEYITISSKGDTTFKLGEIVSPDSFEKENERVKKLGLRPAKGWSKSKGVLRSWGNGDRPPKELEEYEPATVEAEPIPEKYRELTPFIDLPLPPGTDFLPAVVPQEGERKIDVVMRQLKDGVEGIQDSAQFRLFLTIMAKFHDYSIGNQILIMLQKPEATHVAGFVTWKDLGRWVMKGERGISILAPVMPPKPKKEEREEEEEEEIVPVTPVYFKVVHVFDISQTEGKPLPEFDVPVLTGEANEELFGKVLAMAKAQGLEVSFESRPYEDPSIKGQYSPPKSIWVRPEESRAQQLKSLLHEIAHYYSEGVFRIPRRDAETIAESAAFAVGAHFGFDSGVRSFPYVALWAQEKKTLAQNLNTIRKVTDTMLHALEGNSKQSVLAEIPDVSLLAKTEGDPLRKFCCRFSDACAPPELLEEGKFLERISWLRQHYNEKHPGMWGKQKLSPLAVTKGTCYEDAWRFLLKEKEGYLVHGTVWSEGKRIGHAWVETEPGYIWEPQTGRFYTKLGFEDTAAPVVEHRYDVTEASIMATRTKNLGPWTDEERRQYLKRKAAAVIPTRPFPPSPREELEFVSDSPEYIPFSIEQIGYREKLDNAFQSRIAQVQGTE